MTTTNPADGAPRVLGLVMAGGRSSRMGSDKSALEYHGKPQGPFCFELLSKFVDQVCVSVREGQQVDSALDGLPRIEDAHGEIGPMSGVLSAMDHDPTAAWFVMACDLPFIDEQAVRELLAGRDSERMATAYMASDGFLEPLCAIYEPTFAPVLRERLAAGRFSLRHALTNGDVRMVCAPDDRTLTNVNTPEELAKARADLNADEAGL